MKVAAAEREAEDDHRDDRGGFQQHEQALHVAAGAGAEAIDRGERRAERSLRSRRRSVETPLISRKYFAKVTATAAMPPVCVTSSSTHP